MNDRRRHLRVLVPGAYCELVVNGAPLGVVALEDVSDSGVFVGHPRPTIPARTVVQLRFIEEQTPLTLDGTIVQVVQPGAGRSPGYGIELAAPPRDAVERIVDVRASAARVSVGARTPSAPALPSVTVADGAPAHALLLGISSGPLAPMAQALALFGVHAHFGSDAKAAVARLDKATRVVLIEMALLDASRGVAITHVRGAAPKARIMVFVDKLPDVDARAALLRQGTDELLLAPLDVFAVMGKVHALAKK
jgi:hypothetical protein